MTNTNWAGNLTYAASALRRPASVEELQEIIVAAPLVRALGSRHSFNRIADTPGIHISTAGLPDIFIINEAESEVTVSAGLRYGELVERLDRTGWALHNLASLPHISVAGAIATGTHGSGDLNGSLATAVAGLQIVKADGEVHDFARGDDSFAGMIVSLGRLGVVTYVTLDIVPTYEMRQDVFEHLPWSDVAEHFDAITSSAYSVSMFTDWSDDGATSVWLKSRTDHEPPAELFGATPATRNLHPLPGVSAELTSRQLGQPGPWWDRLPHFRIGFTPSNGEELQTEYLVPRTNALKAIAAIRALSARLKPHLLVSEIRTIAGDDLWLSPAHDTDCVALHFTWRRDVPAVAAILPAIDDALAPFMARSHWGKLFETTPERLHLAYPRLTEFRTLSDWFDPAGKFGNNLVDSWLAHYT